MTAIDFNFHDLYRRYHARLIRLLNAGFRCASRTGGEIVVRVLNAADAEEICQETFCAFLERCEDGGFDASRDAAAYLRGIARNLALQRIERSVREVPTEKMDTLLPPAEARDTQPDAGRLLYSLMAMLDERERAVLKHYYEDGEESQEAVGRKLGLSRDQVCRIATRIRLKAKQQPGARNFCVRANGR